MRSINNIFFIGLGAIGAKYASMFYDVNPYSVFVVVDHKRKSKYSTEGVFVNSKKYDFSYVTIPEDTKYADLIILAVKSTDLIEALESIQPFVQENTMIISLMNGISTADIVNDFFGRNVALYSIVYMDAVKKGNQITYGHAGKLIFGEKTNILKTARVEELCELFDRFGITYEVPKDMLLSLWRKFLINVVGNQLTFVLNVGYEGLQDNPYVLSLVQEVGHEVIKIANAQGIGVQQTDIDDMIKTMRMLPGKAMTSMHQDRVNNRISEVDIFAGEMIRLGQKLNISTPYNLMLYNLIKAHEWERDSR